MEVPIHCDIEFLDLSDVKDNQEKNEILTYLNSVNENIQLPWKVHYRPMGHGPEYGKVQLPVYHQGPINAPPSHPYNPNLNYSNNNYISPQHHYQQQQQPQHIAGGVNQQNFVPILNSPPHIAQQQQHYPHHHHHHQQQQQQKYQHQQIQQPQKYIRQPPTTNLTDLSSENPSTVQQNGNTATNVTNIEPQQQQQQPPPQPQRKMYSTLFHNSDSKNNNNVEINGNNVKSAKGDTEKNNNEESFCPIKHPRKAASFVDPNCYRMGEYLSNYIVERKTISLQPRGLINRSNYCYINSILQALLACPPLYNLLSGLAEQNSSNEKQKPTPIIDGMCRFVKQFQHLPEVLRVNRRFEKNYKKDQGINIDCDQAFEPSWIYKMLNGIRSDSFLIDGSQEDAEEFLGCLLNGLNDEMLELMKLVKSDITSRNSCDFMDNKNDEWQVMGPKNKGSVTRRIDIHKTPISDIFGGFLKSRIHRAGDQSTDNIQPFFTLQLNIEKVKSVREALEALVAKNPLEGVTSPKTNEEVEAWQQVTLEELPKILVLHLKCFDFKLNGCTKIMKALEFPIDLKIDSKLLSKPNAPKERQYKLFAIVYHDGKEATKGHYVTDAFHVGYSSWLRYDDASVKTLQEEQVLNPQGTRVPYLLFYRRSDTIKNK